MTTAYLSRSAGNSKTGLRGSYTAPETCPDACPLRVAGCYANGGHVAINWTGRSAASRYLDWPAFCRQVESLPAGAPWRYGTAGDLPGPGDLIDRAELRSLVRAARRSRGFTFTHKPVGRTGLASQNAAAVRSANRSGFTINLSADSLAEADRKADLGIGPVAVTVASDHPARSETPAGRTVRVCPAQIRAVTCADCLVCASATRSWIVAFRAHGVSRDAVDERLRLPLARGDA